MSQSGSWLRVRGELQARIVVYMRVSRNLAAATALFLAAGSFGCSSQQAAHKAAMIQPTPTASAVACVADPAAVAVKAPGEGSATNELAPELVSKLDAAARTSFAEAAAPGAIVGVRTPEGTWTAAYGQANPTIESPMTTDMHSRIGSVTKTFTGTVIMQLAQEGKLSLSDPIEKYYAGIPDGDRITLEQLANMTSGIASYYTEPFLERYFGNPETTFKPDELIAYGVAESPTFEPGAQFNYSNTNTILLGRVIEAVTGQTAAEVFKQRVYEPLGMTATSLPEVSLEIPQPHPQGYTLQGAKEPGQPLNATNWSPSFGWTAGGMISTLRDLLIYNRALGTGQGLLDPAMQVQRLQSFPVPAGYGFALGCIDGWIGHTGELPGFNTALYYDTTTDTSVVVMVNSDIASGDCPESPVLSDNPSDRPCSAPATRVFVGLSEALGHPFQPLPAQ